MEGPSPRLPESGPFFALGLRWNLTLGQVTTRFWVVPSASRPVVLTIAGFDPSSGAGITADLKTIAAFGCYGIAAITALTVQSTQGVSRVEPVAAELLRESLIALAADNEFSAIKVGML